jgi:PPK2 family polyphosphate:nucleotide phosphotransferase
MKNQIPNASKLAKAYEVDNGKHFRLNDVDPADTRGLDLKEESNSLLQHGVEQLSDLQQMLYAQNHWALLLIFQAMDAAGKDGAIRHVMSGVNPQGCQVYSFKAPSTEELDHDFLWRTSKCLPERGRIGIFNRSYYEEVLITRVHPEIMAREPLPPKLKTKHIWKERFEDINAFERYLSHNGVVVRKFFLHISKEEQKQRFLSRLDDPNKNWKFSEADAHEREYWDGYMHAYEDMIRRTATANAPWYVVPSDQKWFTRLVVASIITKTLEELKLAYPRVDQTKKKDLARAKKVLLGERSR